MMFDCMVSKVACWHAGINFSLLFVSFTIFSCLFPIFSRTSLLRLFLMFPSEFLLDAEEKVEEEVEVLEVLEVPEMVLETELVVTLELTECLLTVLPAPPPSPRPSPRPPTPS